MSAPLTRTHVYIFFGNPYLRCAQCFKEVTGWHDPDKCGCTSRGVNLPCRCRLGVEVICPSWASAGGCVCEAGTHDRVPLALVS